MRTGDTEGKASWVGWRRGRPCRPRPCCR